MQKFTSLTGVAAPLPMINVDTDMIIPKQFLKTIKRTGLGKNLFDEMRYNTDGSEKPDFVLNRPAYRKASILVAGQIAGRRMRMFHVYSAGNFIEAAPETPYFQIGETKYGKPILDRVANFDIALEDAVKLAMISMDSTDED